MEENASLLDKAELEHLDLLKIKFKEYENAMRSKDKSLKEVKNLSANFKQVVDSKQNNKLNNSFDYKLFDFSVDPQ